MATIVKSTPKKELPWAWRDGEYVEGTAVSCINHQFKAEERSFVCGTIAPNEDHGWSTAASSYYYLVTGGSGIVYISEDDNFIGSKSVKVKEGDCFKIGAGTTYNYRAGADGLSFVLFMNNLWEE